MSSTISRRPVAVGLIGCLASSARATTALAETAAEIDASAEIAIATLLEEAEVAAALTERAVGIRWIPVPSAEVLKC